MSYKVLGREVSGLGAILLSPVVLLIVILAIPLAFISGIWCQIFPWKMSKEELLEYLEFFVNGDPESDDYYGMYDQFICGGPIEKGPVAEIVERIRAFPDAAETGEATFFSDKQLDAIKGMIEEAKELP